MAFLLLSAAAGRAEGPKYVPASVFNGVSWKKFDDLESDAARMAKVCLVRGIYEGAYAMDPENALEQYGPWVSFGTLTESLDRFYREERNMKIPVTQALVLIARNANGAVPQPSSPPRSGSGSGGALVSMGERS